MLKLVIPESKVLNESTNELCTVGGGVLELEHSLHAVSKWEEITKKPFLEQDGITAANLLLYIKCMCDGQVDDSLLAGLTTENVEQVTEYIADTKTATWFREEKKRPGKKRVITSELIYYWMSAYGIPFEPCDRWHLSRLMTLLRVAGEEQKQPEKMDGKSLAKRNSSLNAARRAARHSRG